MQTDAIAICIDNKLDMYDIVLRNYPDCIKDYKLYYIIEPLLNIDVTRLVRMLDNYNITNYEIIYTTEMIERFAENCVDSTFLRKYKGNSKTLTGWYLFKYTDTEKLLMLEGDILLTTGFETVFKNNSNAIYLYDGNIASDKSIETAMAWKRLTGKDIHYYTPWAAPMMIVKSKTNSEYVENLLKSVYADKYFIDKLSRSRAWHVSYFDQTMLGMLYLDRDDVIDLKPMTSLIIMGPNNINIHYVISRLHTKKFIHICCKSKREIVNELVDEGVLN